MAERKYYGHDDGNISAGLAHMHRVGDPEFVVDSQNNDEFYTYDTDAATTDYDDAKQEYNEA